MMSFKVYVCFDLDKPEAERSLKDLHVVSVEQALSLCLVNHVLCVNKTHIILKKTTYSVLSVI